MTGIDTEVAHEHWKDEGRYLDKIEFACLTEDKKNISLITDEEGNDEIILTPIATRWLIKRLKFLLEEVEKNE